MQTLSVTTFHIAQHQLLERCYGYFIFPYIRVNTPLTDATVTPPQVRADGTSWRISKKKSPKEVAERCSCP